MFALFPEILQIVQKGDLETLACLLRKYFGEQQIYSPRFEVEALLAQMGISLKREVTPYFGRIQALDHKGQYYVTVTLDARIRDRMEINFTLAHLLAYFLVEIQPMMARGELTAEAFQLEGGALARLLEALSDQARSRNRKNSILQPADQLAIALLLPLGMVKKAHLKFSSVQDTAAFFNVNPALIVHRLQIPDRLSTIAAAQAQPSAALAKAQPQAPAAAPGSEPAPRGEKPLRETSSLTRVQKSVASLSYRREESRKTQAEPARETSGEGMKRLRELAKKIDRSVDV